MSLTAQSRSGRLRAPPHGCFASFFTTGSTTGVIAWSMNKSGLEELCANLSSAEAREFVWLCIVDSEMRLTDIASHRAAGDLKKVAEVAQRIAREAARLGALRVHVLALRLETACRAGSDGTYGLISDLSDAWGEVGEALCAWLTGQASPVAA
jgi:HPt (histidine-containing phosphotransfer) domain-containing protein